MTFVKVLQSPSNTVPSLSSNDIYIILIDSIKAYVDKKITLQTLIDITSKIKTFRGINETINSKVDSILEELISLSKFLNLKKNKKNKINQVLINTLDNILKKN